MHYFTLSITALLLVLLFLKRDKKNYYLVGLLSIIFFGELSIIINIKAYRVAEFLLPIIDASITLIGPIIYLYTAFFTRKNIKYPLIHLVPFFVAITLSYLLNFQFTNSLAIVVVLHVILKPILTLIYLALVFKFLRNYKIKRKALFSYPERKEFQWLEYVIFSTFVAFILYTILIIIQTLQLSIGFSPENAIYILLASFVFLFGIYGINSSHVFTESIDLKFNSNNLSIETKNKIKYSKNGSNPTLSQQQIDDFWLLITATIEKNKCYLEEKFTLQDLSIQTNIHQKNISISIKNKFGSSFFNFINSYRIKEFQSRIKAGDNERYDIISIAYDCGFNSKSSFYRAFKKETSLTPSEYLKNISL